MADLMHAFLEVAGGTLPWIAIGAGIWWLIGWDERRLG